VVCWYSIRCANPRRRGTRDAVSSAAVASVILEHISKRFAEVPAVRDVSITVQDQEFLVLVGPSGCGSRRFCE